jgi:hypothetical protein
VNWALGSTDENPLIPTTPQGEDLARDVDAGGDIPYDAELQERLAEHAAGMLAAGEVLAIECGSDVARYNTAMHYYLGLQQGAGPMLGYQWDGQTFRIFPP